MIERVKKSYKNKQIYIIHNFLNLNQKSFVEKQVEKDIQMAFPVDKLPMIGEKGEEFFQYIQREGREKNCCVTHLIYGQEGSESGDYFNKHTINNILRSMESNKEFQTFDIIDIIKKFCEKKLNNYIISGEKDEKEWSLKIKDESKKESLILTLEVKNPNNFKVKEGSYDVFGALIQNQSDFDPNYYIVEDQTKLSIWLNAAGFCKGKDSIILKDIRGDGNGKILIEGGINLHDLNGKITKNHGHIKGNFKKLIELPNSWDNYDYKTKKMEYVDGIFMVIIPKTQYGEGTEEKF